MSQSLFLELAGSIAVGAKKNVCIDIEQELKNCKERKEVQRRKRE